MIKLGKILNATYADFTLKALMAGTRKRPRERLYGSFIWSNGWRGYNSKINNMVGTMKTYYCGNLCWWQNMQCQALSDVSQREQAFLQDLAPQSLQRTPRPIRNGARQQAQRLLSTTTRFVPLAFDTFLNFSSRESRWTGWNIEGTEKIIMITITRIHVSIALHIINFITY